MRSSVRPSIRLSVRHRFISGLYLNIMLRLHWATFSPRPYHVLRSQERGEDGVKMKQFLICKFTSTSLLRPHHVLTTSQPRPYYVRNTSCFH